MSHIPDLVTRRVISSPKPTCCRPMSCLAPAVLLGGCTTTTSVSLEPVPDPRNVHNVLRLSGIVSFYGKCLELQFSVSYGTSYWCLRIILPVMSCLVSRTQKPSPSSKFAAKRQSAGIKCYTLGVDGKFFPLLNKKHPPLSTVHSHLSSHRQPHPPPRHHHALLILLLVLRLPLSRHDVPAGSSSTRTTRRRQGINVHPLKVGDARTGSYCKSHQVSLPVGPS
jgi:hypothetical protein